MVKNLRKLRLLKGVSQQQLAEIIGTSQQSINKYENQGVEPDILGLTKLADYFGATIDELVGRAPPDNPLSLEELEWTKEEILLIRDYRRLSREEKDSIRLILRNYLQRRES